MPSSPAPLPGHSGHHAVQFYKDSRRLCISAADFLGDGIAAGQPIVVIATPVHRAALRAELMHRHFDVDALVARGDMAILDAAETLDLFMRAGMPEPALFRRVVGRVIDAVCRGRTDCVLRAYGEMVDVLWQRGETEAAIRLEVLWNELATHYDFSLLCGYSIGAFYKQPAEATRVCREHTHADVLEPMQ